MSDFPGEITKQILSAPPRIRRSMRYSDTAQGRSIPLSLRLPTGSNSFEKARGWIRLPRPAAGTIPHIVRLLEFPVDGASRLSIARAAPQVRRRVSRNCADRVFAPARGPQCLTTHLRPI